MCVKAKMFVAHLCPALCDLWIVAAHNCCRLLCPWNSPGKNTGVGCHSLLPDPGIKPWSPALQADSLPAEPL